MWVGLLTVVAAVVGLFATGTVSLNSSALSGLSLQSAPGNQNVGSGTQNNAPSNGSGNQNNGRGGQYNGDVNMPPDPQKVEAAEESRRLADQ